MALDTLDTTQQNTGAANPIADLYESVFNRQADTGGLNYWTQQYQNGTSLSDIENAFKQSSEYLNKPVATTTASQPIADIYQSTLGRAPDTGGYNNYNQQLSSGRPIEQIRAEIAASQEAQQYATKTKDYTPDITSIYQTTLGRAPDADGLEYYQQQLASGKSIDDIRNEIARSQEGVTTPGGQITQVYQDVLNRAPDAEGLEYYKQQLDAGKTIDQIKAEIAASQEAKPVEAPTDFAGYKNEQAELQYTRGQDLGEGSYGKDAVTEYYTPGSVGRYEMKPDADGYDTIPVWRPSQQNFAGLELSSGGYGKGYYTNKDGIEFVYDSASDSFEGQKDPQALAELKQTNPNEYYKVLGNQISDGIFAAWSRGNNGAATSSYAELEKLKDTNPTAYYDSVLSLYGKQMGWQHGQNTSERNAETIEKLKALVPEAQKAGLSDDQINSIVKNNFAQASAQNQQRIARDAESGGGGFNLGKDIMPGVKFVGLTALGWMAGDPSLGWASSVGSALTPIGTSAAIANTVGSTVIGAALGATSSLATGGDPLKGAAVGGVAAGVQSGMAPLMNEIPTSTWDSISAATGNTFTPAQLKSVVGSTFARTLASAASGANGDKILNAFTTALVSSGLSTKAADLVTKSLGDTLDSDTVAKMAKATGILTNTAATSVLSGKTPEQIQAALITSFMNNLKDIGGAKGTGSGTGAPSSGGTEETGPGTGTGENPYAKMTDEQIQYAIDKGFGSNPTPEQLNEINNLGKTTIANLTDDKSEEFFGIPADQVKAILADTSSLIGSDKALVASTSLVMPFGKSGYGGTTSYIDLPKVSTELKASVDLAEKQDLSQGLQVTGTSFKPTLDLQQYAEEKTALDAEFKNETISKEEYNKALSDLDKEFDSQIPGAQNAINLFSVLVNTGVPTKDALNKAANSVNINPSDLAKLISGSGPTAATGTSTTGKVTGTVTGAAGVTGTTGTGPGVTGTTGGGSGVTGTTGGGGGGTGGDGTGTAGTGIGTGTGTAGTGTGGGGSGGGGGGSGGSGGGTTPVTTNPLNYGKSAAEDVQSIYNLMPGLTKANTNYELAGRFGMATGGAVATSQYDPFGLGTSDFSGISDSSSPFVGSTLKMPKLTTGTTKKNVDYNLAGYNPVFKADGGIIDHKPQFFSEGGLGTLENRYVKGDGDGTSDEVPAMLANGEFVIPADVVSRLGNGSNDAGADVLDQFLAVIREHTQKHNPKNLPPDSKGPLAYLSEAKKRA